MALRDTMVSWWRMEEASGDRIDEHGSNDLTDNNTVTSEAAKLDDGAVFNGTTEYLDIADATQSGLDLSDDCSFAFWINQDTTTGDRWIICKSRFDGSLQGYDIWASGGAINWRFSDDGSNTATHKIDGISNASSIGSNNTWYHVVVVLDISTDAAICYVDGVDVTSSNTGTMGLTLNNNAQPFVIGRRDRTTPSSYFDGTIDEVSVYSSALTSTEVAELYNSGTGIDYAGTAPAVGGTNSGFFAMM